jgi:hypothetical protein
MSAGLTPKFGVLPRTRGRRERPNIGRMERRLILELEQGSPPSGRVIAPDGSAIRFAGWTELAQALSPNEESEGKPGGDPHASGTPRG